jgi:hypothetical protein
MLFNALVLLLLVFVAYMWVLRGFFSALIHLVCTVIAGAVAFGVWEPLSYWILESAPTSGVGSHLTGMAWGIGLIVPFGLTLAILRLVVDKMLPANVVISQQLNYVGGGLCGILAGVLTAGIVATGLSFFRIPEFSPSLRYANQGNLERAGALWVPVDKLTGRFYGMLSETSFRTSEPLARWHPFVHEEGGSLQLSAFEGKNRNTTRPSDFDVVARFQVGEPGKANFASLLTDQWHPGVTQKVRDLDGNDFPANTHIEMFVVNFKAGAKEKEGKVSVGSAQVRLLLENQEGERMVVHPITVASQASSERVAYGRWWYDADQTFIGSVGGAADAVFAFEFPCPPGYEPIALYVKGARHNVSEGSTAKPKAVFRSAAERDGLIVTAFAAVGGGGARVDDLDMTSASKAEFPRGEGVQGRPPVDMLVQDTLRTIIQKGTHDTLELDEENNRNIIINGRVVLDPKTVANTRGLERSLIINRLLVASDQNIVQLDAHDGTQWSVLDRVFTNQEEDAPPTLYDADNIPYVPVGYVYQDETKFELRYTPGQPITKMSDLPRMSLSRNQKLTLIYRVSKGVRLAAYGCGKKITRTIEPPFLLDANQGGGR